jgi:hypothetical protein
MTVVDRAGQRIGQVVRVQLPPPRVTHPPDSDIIDAMVDLPAPPDMTEASAEFDVLGMSPVGHDPADLPSDLPDAVRQHLDEVGFIEIRGPSLHEVDRFVAADHIDSVTQDQVVIRAARAHER